MEKLLLAVREFMEAHHGELAQDPELSAMLRWLVARLKAKRGREGIKQRKPRVRWF
jgi:hypothetical protein